MTTTITPPEMQARPADASTAAASATAARGNRLPAGTALADAATFTKRHLLRQLRTPQNLVLSIVQTALFLLLFRFVFGGSIHIPGLSYADYLIPAFLVQVAIFDGFGIAIDQAGEASNGVLDRFRSLPMTRIGPLWGRCLSDLARQVLLLAVTVALGLAVGFRFGNGVLPSVAAIGLCLVFGMALSWLFMAIGQATRNAQAAQGMTMPFFMLVFVSTAYIQVSSLPGWLQPIARNQPISMVTNAVRGLIQGQPAAALVDHATAWYVVVSLIWCVVLGAAGMVLARLAYERE